MEKLNMVIMTVFAGGSLITAIIALIRTSKKYMDEKMNSKLDVQDFKQYKELHKELHVMESQRLESMDKKLDKLIDLHMKK